MCANIVQDDGCWAERDLAKTGSLRTALGCGLGLPTQVVSSGIWLCVSGRFEVLDGAWQSVEIWWAVDEEGGAFANKQHGQQTQRESSALSQPTPTRLTNLDFCLLFLLCWSSTTDSLASAQRVILTMDSHLGFALRHDNGQLEWSSKHKPWILLDSSNLILSDTSGLTRRTWTFSSIAALGGSSPTNPWLLTNSGELVLPMHGTAAPLVPGPLQSGAAPQTEVRRRSSLFIRSPHNPDLYKPPVPMAAPTEPSRILHALREHDSQTGKEQHRGKDEPTRIRAA
ncbi:hypothetical protein K438DRAFT_1760153 [Mycena galopus ATCC 62051]|nr:hypothetical protein K438DRAFT_1760153 [Mycena galopus ATCC 62051]